MNKISLYDSILFVLAVLGGLFVANLILILFKSQIRISIIGSIVLTLALLFVQLL
jgi:hypothetical protein